MKREKKRGLILIVIGICMPIVSLPFVAGFDPGKGIMKNVYETGIPLQKANEGAGETSVASVKAEAKKTESLAERLTPRMVPLRYILALGVFLVFIGIVKLDKARKSM